jgi:hypothetical protein
MDRFAERAITLEQGAAATCLLTRELRHAASHAHPRRWLPVHRITDFEGWTDTLWLDGAVRYTWPAQAPAGCLSGGYLFDTRTPLHRPNLDSAALDAGELVINRDVTVRAFAPGNVPPGLPTPTLGMLLNVKVRGVGTFNFDAESLNGPALWGVAQCPYQ